MQKRKERNTTMVYGLAHTRTVMGLVAVLMLASGCITLEPDEKLPEAVADVPEAYAEPEVQGLYEPLHWWMGFEDTRLNQLIDSALVANLDLVQAAARVDEVRAQFRSTRAGRYPGLSGSADVSYTDSPTNSGQAAFFGGFGGDSTGAGGGVNRFSNTTYTASLGFSYEVDFWGRVRNDTRAAFSEARATEADFATVRLGVIAETIATYFEVFDIRARIGLTVETVGILAERVDRTQERYDRGLATSFELYQIRQDYRNTQASLPQLESQLVDAEARLAVVLGRYAGQIDTILGDELQPVLDFNPIPVGLPADLLVQRPDVRSAAYRMEAARYRIGARRAELFPTLSLSGALGTQSSNLSDLFKIFDQWTLNLGAGLTAPLFQGGRLRANVAAARARYTQQAAFYAQTVLIAFQEVVTAMEQYEEERQRYAFFVAQLEEAEAAADLQADRYQAGLTDYTAYLDALRTLYQVQTSLSAGGRQVAMARLAVHRALGGGWTDDGRVPRFEFIEASVPLSETVAPEGTDVP